MRTSARITRLTVAAALGLSLAACGSSSGSGGTSAAGKASTSAATGGSAAGPSSSAPSSESSSGSSASAGGSDQAGAPDGKTLVHQARSAYNAAKSASMHADITDSKGDRQQTDIKGTLDGTNQEVTMDQGAKGVITVRAVGGKYYIKGDKAFWLKGSGAPKSSAALLTDRWVIMPSSQAGTFKEVTIKNFLDEILGPKNVTDAEASRAKTARSSYQGKPAYVITSAKKTNKNTITIASDSKYVLEVDGEKAANSTGKGKVTFAGWDKQPRLAAPKGAINLPSSMK